MTSSSPAAAEVVDPRGPRFAAIITSVVLAAAVALGPTWGLPLLIVQTVVFAVGALLGLRYHPYGWLFRVLVRPRLAPPAELEDARPPRFAQSVGLGFALAGVLGGVFGLAVLFYLAVGFALVAALLNAVFDYCLGCELYLWGKRLQASTNVEGA
ncbi:MAG: DUF4395 domain-containing protein [Propionibacteriales bacterium]|nr:DUF4395 domain-containing protein [Propionibacteriales bacterium]